MYSENYKSFLRCSNCVLSLRDRRVELKEGICNFCRSDPFRGELLISGRSELSLPPSQQRFFQAYTGSKNKCVVGLSGGVDSSFLVMRLVEDLDIRPLILHVDAGWNSASSLMNIRRIVDHYDLDLEVVVVNWDAQRALHLAFLRSGILNQDIPQDLALFSNLYHFLYKSKIKTAFSGANLSTEGVSRPLDIFYFASDMIFNKSICPDPFIWRRLIHYGSFAQKVMSWISGIKFHSPLLKLPYNKGRSIELMTERFGFHDFPEKHYESLFTKFFEGSYLIRRVGYDVREVDYSSLIMSGQMSRAEALKRLSSPPLTRVEEYFTRLNVANQLEITLDELDAYEQQDVVSVHSYPNMQLLYKSIVRLLSKLGTSRYFGRE